MLPFAIILSFFTFIALIALQVYPGGETVAAACVFGTAAVAAWIIVRFENKPRGQ